MKHFFVGGVVMSLVLMGASCSFDYDLPGEGDYTAADQERAEMEGSETVVEDDEVATDWRTPIENGLKKAFAQKYNKPAEKIEIKIGLYKEDKYVRGQVGLPSPDAPSGTGYEGAIFFAAQDAVSGDWILVHDGNGVIPCEPLELYDFPRTMTGGCFEGE